MTVIDNLTRWINSSGLFEEEGENKGGVHSYFDQNNLEFGFLYPEITGYFINSQRFLYKITNDKKLIDNALTSAEISAENYPFCTIDPNVGVVPVPDIRLAKLSNMEELFRELI